MAKLCTFIHISATVSEKRRLSIRDTNKYGCHYDLLPTIAPFAFKNVEYIKMGNDLLSKNVTISNSYSYNECQILAEKEYKVEAERIIRARNLLLKLYIQKVLGMNK